jgi:hypothetical protein
MKAYKLTPGEWALVNLARRYNLDPKKVLAVAIDKLIAESGVMAFETEGK